MHLPETETTSNNVPFPTRSEIEEILRVHPLFRLQESVSRAFVVGSFAKGTQTLKSNLDILLEVSPRDGLSSDQLAESYRRALKITSHHRQIKNEDDTAPRWRNRTLNVHFTYSADSGLRPKLELPRERPYRPEAFVAYRKWIAFNREILTSTPSIWDTQSQKVGNFLNPNRCSPPGLD